MTSDEKIIECLDTLAEAEIDRPLFREPRWLTSPMGEALLKALREDHQIEARYNERLHLVANGAGAHSLKGLARWMVERSHVENAAKTVERVRNFLGSPTFTAWAVLLLTGLIVDKEYDLGGEVSLLPFDRLPTTNLRTLSWDAFFSSSPLPRPEAGLVFRLEHPRRDYPTTGDPKVEPYTVETGTLEDARLTVGTGTFTLTGANTFSGTTDIDNGSIIVGHADALQDSTVSINVDDGLDVTTSAIDATIGALAGGGNLDLGSQSLTAGGSDASTTYSGALSGAGPLSKTGAGASIGVLDLRRGLCRFVRKWF